MFIYVDENMMKFDSKEGHNEEEVWVEEDSEACHGFVSGKFVHPVMVCSCLFSDRGESTSIGADQQSPAATARSSEGVCCETEGPGGSPLSFDDHRRSGIHMAAA